ncbi:MAG TPA: hypothetical protein VFK56_09390 [Mycobacterium sp.]|nr:hypothetical protein [Mycobacterium sp.]
MAGDQVVVLWPGADLDVGIERFGDLLAHKLFECHAGDVSDQLANQVGEGEHVEAVSGGRHGPGRPGGS